MRTLAGIAGMVDKAGADRIVICANTPRLVADNVRKKLNVPLVHIAEETAKAIVKLGCTMVALIDTQFTIVPRSRLRPQRWTLRWLMINALPRERPVRN